MDVLLKMLEKLLSDGYFAHNVGKVTFCRILFVVLELP